MPFLIMLRSLIPGLERTMLLRTEWKDRSVQGQASNKAAGNGKHHSRYLRNRFASEAALIAAAGKLFAAHGYEATKTREIAIEAGRAEGLIHRYFGGKEGLLVALLGSRCSREVADLDRLRPASNIEDEIIQLVSFEMERCWQDREFLKVIIPRAMLDSPRVEIIQEAMPIQRTSAIVQRLKKSKHGRKLSQSEL